MTLTAHKNQVHCPGVVHRDVGNGVHDGSTAPLPFERGAMGVQVPLHNSVIGNFRDAGEW